jgi:polysaccharide biosynthesis protein PslA
VTASLSERYVIASAGQDSTADYLQTLAAPEAIPATSQIHSRLSPQPLTNTERLGKRVFDCITATIIVLSILPVLLAVCALIRLDSRGPVLFRQPRVGLNGHLFTCLKFRTMHHHAADLLADRQTSRDDPRITRVGRCLRRTSLDELPQLFNVIFGDMSLVGPRPHAPNTKAGGRLFTEASPDYARRQTASPGITGWAQVHGWRGETATLHQLHQRVEHDLYYIENWSFRLDIYILFRTITHGFTGPQTF